MTLLSILLAVTTGFSFAALIGWAIYWIGVLLAAYNAMGTTFKIGVWLQSNWLPILTALAAVIGIGMTLTDSITGILGILINLLTGVGTGATTHVLGRLISKNK